MNNSASEPLLGAPSIDKQPIHNYIDSYQLYIQHCTHAVNQLTYHLVTLLRLSFCISHAQLSAKW